MTDKLQVYKLRVDTYFKVTWLHKIGENHADWFLNKDGEFIDSGNNYYTQAYQSKSYRESMGVIKKNYKVTKVRDKQGWSDCTLRLESK